MKQVTKYIVPNKFRTFLCFVFQVTIDIPYASPPQGVKYFTIIGPHIDCMDDNYLVSYQLAKFFVFQFYAIQSWKKYKRFSLRYRKTCIFNSIEWLPRELLVLTFRRDRRFHFYYTTFMLPMLELLM